MTGQEVRRSKCLLADLLFSPRDLAPWFPGESSLSPCEAAMTKTAQTGVWGLVGTLALIPYQRNAVGQGCWASDSQEPWILGGAVPGTLAPPSLGGFTVSDFGSA